MPTLVKLDDRGRLVLPADLRRVLQSDIVEVREHKGKILLTPVKNPLDKLRRRVSRAKPFRRLGEVAEEEAANSLSKG